MKCQYRAHTYPPKRLVSGANSTGFQIASPREDDQPPIHGMAKYAPFCRALCLRLMRMLRAREEIELDHLPAIAQIAAPRDEVAPFAVQVDESEVDQPVHEQHPHHREMPVPGAT